MNNKKNEGKSFTSKNSFNANTSQIKTLINSEMSRIRQDLLFFKNDMLLDIRKVEERFNIKLTEQSIINSDQYDSFDKKLYELSERITKVNSMMLDNCDLAEKIKAFTRFKTKAEDNLNRLSSQSISIQKENNDTINNIERMINENLRYPGIFGKNAKFLNLRYFIDYTMRNIKDLNIFRDEIKNFNLNDLRRDINRDISDFRFSISDNYKNSLRLIGNNFKEFDKKIDDLNKRNSKFMKENEAKFEEFKININKYFSEYQDKLESLEKNLSDKYKEQLKEIDNLKNINNELSTKINDTKSYLEKIKESNNINNINTNNNGRNQKNIQSDNINNFIFQAISTKNKKYNMIMKELINNNNINLFDNYQNSVVQHNTELSPSRNASHRILDKSKSFENLPENNNFKIRNKSKDLSFEQKNEFDSYLNMTNRDFRRNNYSISNIANIKIKKVILPNYISKKNINRTSNSLLSENKGTILISNDLTTNIPQKSMYLNDSIINMKKSEFNISKINKQKFPKNKNRNKNLVHSARTINRKAETINPEKINSLLVIKPKNIKLNNILKNIDSFKKGKKYNLSFEKKKSLKDEKFQIGLRKSINLKNNFKEIILMNSKNFKKNRKIQL